jgi:predicted transposase
VLKLTAKIRLNADADQRKALLETIEQANACCNWVSEYALSGQVFPQFSLHKLLYYHAKELFPLSAQVVVHVFAKAALAGVLLVAVDPRNSSRECSHCGHTAKENRKTQDKFACVECGFALHADINAAINIRSRASRQVANRSELCCA